MVKYRICCEIVIANGGYLEGWSISVFSCDIFLKFTMKRSSNAPSTSTGKIARSTRFTTQQVLDALDDSDKDEVDFLQ